MTDTTTPVSHQLASVVDELGPLIERLQTVSGTARGLTGATDWQAKAATAFHELAEAWAGEVLGLICLAETARIDAANARDRARFREADAYAAAHAPAGAR